MSELNTSKAESIVTSLEWSRKLKEAGWPQEECVFRWFDGNKCEFGFGYQVVSKVGTTIDKEPFLALGLSRSTDEMAAAPTAEEILRRLPANMPIDGFGTVLVCFPEEGGWKVAYEVLPDEELTGELLSHASDKSLVNAAAAMYCYLAENNLLPKFL